jgi:hypothetical protein
MTDASDQHPSQSTTATSRGGPLDVPGGNNGRPGEDRDGPAGALVDATDLDFEGGEHGKSPMEDAGAPGGTAGTTDVARVQDD